MATKKQKRLAASAKRAEFEAEIRASGLEAQRKDREHRAAQAERAKDDAEWRQRKVSI